MRFLFYLQVSYSLLIFFCGMFITVDGFNKTGIPSTVWEFMEPYAKIDHTSGVATLALVVLVLSNVASNVPTGKWNLLVLFSYILVFLELYSNELVPFQNIA